MGIHDRWRIASSAVVVCVAVLATTAEHAQGQELPSAGVNELRTGAPTAPANPFDTGAAADARADRFFPEDRNVEGNKVSSRIPDYSPILGTKTASLSMDWVTPESVMIGETGRFELVVRNHGRVAVKDVRIEDAVPATFKLVKATPEPLNIAGKGPTWTIAEIEPQQEARISLQLKALKVGTSASKARIVFSTSSSAAFRVVEPKLELVAEAPKQVIVGDRAVFHLHVKNPGTGKTTNTVVKVLLPKSMVGEDRAASYEIGDLNPGETRSIRVLAKTVGLGKHECEFVATADHSLQDSDEKKVEVLGAKLEVALDGPAFRYVTRPARYTVRVKNTGTTAANNVALRTEVPKAFAFVAGDESGRFDSRTKHINWFVGTLDVGEEYVGKFTLRAEDRGNFPLLAEAAAERGLKAEDKHSTRVDGIAAILLEVVDVDDPVEVGAETFYEILITNQGTEFAKNVEIKVTAPEGMQIIGSKGPSAGAVEGRILKFAPLTRLAPRADAIYRVHVRSAKPGDLRIEVEANADSLAAPVTELESTKVYRDE